MWAEAKNLQPSDERTLLALVAVIAGAARIERVLRVHASIPSVASAAADDPHVLALLGALRWCARVRTTFGALELPPDRRLPPKASPPPLRSILR